MNKIEKTETLRSGTQAHKQVREASNMASDNAMANKSCERRPMTKKEIKFFGTAISFDEPSTKQNNSIKCAAPKFFRTQSFGVLSPRMSRNKRFVGSNHRDDVDDIDGNETGGVAGIQRDTNFNYNTIDSITKTIIMPDKLCNIRGAISAGTLHNATSSKLDMVQEDSDSAGDGNSEILMNRRRIRYVQQQSLQSASATRPNRLLRLRMHQFRRRSTSCDSWDHQLKARYGEHCMHWIFHVVLCNFLCSIAERPCYVPRILHAFVVKLIIIIAQAKSIVRHTKLDCAIGGERKKVELVKVNESIAQRNQGHAMQPICMLLLYAGTQAQMHELSLTC